MKDTSVDAPVASRSQAAALVVREGEEPWTPVELDEVRGHLLADQERLREEMAASAEGIVAMMREGGDGPGSDQADIGSSSLERDAEMSLVHNAREMLFQIEHALRRTADGTYGICESCGNAIGKQRLLAFPRATLCVTCKQREERR